MGTVLGVLEPREDSGARGAEQATQQRRPQNALLLDIAVGAHLFSLTKMDIYNRLGHTQCPSI